MDQFGSATYVVQAAFTVRMDGGNNHAAQNSKKLRPTIESCMISAAVTVSTVVGYAKVNVDGSCAEEKLVFFSWEGLSNVLYAVSSATTIVGLDNKQAISMLLVPASLVRL
jgi:hypothetical protein